MQQRYLKISHTVPVCQYIYGTGHRSTKKTQKHICVCYYQNEHPAPSSSSKSELGRRGFPDGPCGGAGLGSAWLGTLGLGSTGLSIAGLFSAGLTEVDGRGWQPRLDSLVSHGLAVDEDDVENIDLLACREMLPREALDCTGDGVAMFGTGMGNCAVE